MVTYAFECGKLLNGKILQEMGSKIEYYLNIQTSSTLKPPGQSKILYEASIGRGN